MALSRTFRLHGRAGPQQALRLEQIHCVLDGHPAYAEQLCQVALRRQPATHLNESQRNLAPKLLGHIFVGSGLFQPRESQSIADWLSWQQRGPFVGRAR